MIASGAARVVLRRSPLAFRLGAVLVAGALTRACADPGTAPAAPEAIESRTVELGGSELHYLVAGPAAGRPVLLLHGMQYHSGTWRELGTIELLAQAGYRVLALDLPGFGLSGQTELAVEFLLREVLAAVPVERPAVVVAPSMSGVYAFPLFIDHPEAVAGFVAVAPAGIDRHEAELPRIGAPTLVVWGEDDPILPVAMADKLAAGVRGSVKVILPGEGHSPYLTLPEAFHRELLAFLEGLPEARWH